MELKLIELTHIEEICKIYEIYKYCMFIPTEEIFDKKMKKFIMDNSIKIFACYNRDKMAGVIVISFMEERNIEIIGIAVDISLRGNGIGSYMINQIVNDYDITHIYAETDSEAVGFYRKNGFNVIKFNERYDNETVIRYKCKFKR